jgi:hypothetical protein
VWEWVAAASPAGEQVGAPSPQYAVVPGKLLAYHPVREKYQILLGFCLAYYDRVNRKNRSQSLTTHPAPPHCIALAGVAAPERRVTEFLVSIEQALADLAGDGVVPGLRLARPEGWPEMLAKRDARAVIAGSWVTFPPLAGDGRHASLPPGVGNPALGRRNRADETRQ